MKGIKFFSNQGTCPFPGGDSYEIVKIHWWNLKIVFPRTTWPILTKLGTKHPRVKVIQVCSNEEPFNSQKVDNGVFSSLNQRYVCYHVYCFLRWALWPLGLLLKDGIQKGIDTFSFLCHKILCSIFYVIEFYDYVCYVSLITKENKYFAKKKRWIAVWLKPSPFYYRSCQDGDGRRGLTKVSIDGMMCIH